VFWLVIVAIAAFGILQASLGLGRGLTLDEPFAANVVRLGWSQMLAMVWRHETPLYHILLKGWVSLSGESEIALRSFSVLCFALTIGTVGYTAKRLGGVWAGYSAACLMSVSLMGLQLAGTARMYALLSLQVAVAALLCFRILELFDPSAPSPSVGKRILFCALLVGLDVMGLLNHSVYFFTMCAWNIAALLVSRRVFLVLILCNLLSLALHLGLWGPHLYQLVHTPATAWMRVPRLTDLTNGVLRLWGNWGTLFLATCLLLFSLMRWSKVKQFLRCRQGLVSATTLVLLIALPFLVSQVKPVYFDVRTPALFLPMACVFVGLLVAHLERARLAAVVVLVLAVGSLWTSVTSPPEEPGGGPARASVRYVVERAQCGDTVISVGLAINEVTYYLRRFGAEGCLGHLTFPASMHEHPGWADFSGLLNRPEALDQEAELLVDGLLESNPAGTVWLFYDTDAPHKDVVNHLKGQLDRRMDQVEALDLSGSFFNLVLAYSPKGE
jgi:hypothetical protein